MMKKVIIVFGYNNTRIYDVEKIKLLAKNKFNADIVLAKNNINDYDKRLTKYTLAIDLEINNLDNIKSNIHKLNSYLHHKGTIPIACLPFSDRGVPLGSYFASQLGLCHDSEDKAFACIRKDLFRQLEKDHKTPIWYKKPKFKRLSSFDELLSLNKSLQGSFFIKPVAEGNSRGCIRIDTIADIYHHQDTIMTYLNKDGMLAEQCITGCDEFSFDGVGNRYVITEKKTMGGQYPVEIQHIVPANLTDEENKRLFRASEIVNDIVGSNGGAVHHEFFLNTDNSDVIGYISSTAVNRNNLENKLSDIENNLTELIVIGE